MCLEFTPGNERVASLHLWLGDRCLAVVCVYKLSSRTEDPPSESPWVGYLRVLMGNDSDTGGAMPGGKSQVWEEFGKAMEKDYRSALT